MEFRTRITSGKEVLFVGQERGNARTADAWLVSGRWKISMSALDAYLTRGLADKSFGSSIDRFVFCFEIADFENWGEFFKSSGDYTNYRPKRKEVWSAGQLRWTDVKDLDAHDQMLALRKAVQVAICRTGEKRRRPVDFAYAAFAAAVEALLERAPEESVLAKPSA